MGPARTPYEEILGSGYTKLDPQVQIAHTAPLSAIGELDVSGGSHWLTPLMARLLKLPKNGAGQPVDLSLSCDYAGRMTWQRTIGNAPLVTSQFASGGMLIERSGAGSIMFRLAVDSGALTYSQVHMRFLGIKIPAKLAPHVSARVQAIAAGWHVAVTVMWRNRMVCHYEGNMHTR